jgi:hypothetical protein
MQELRIEFSRAGWLRITIGALPPEKIKSFKYETQSLASWAFAHRFKKPMSPVKFTI